MVRCPRVLLLAACAVAACADVEPAEPPGPPWTEGPELPEKRLDAAATAIGTRLAIVGGFSRSAAEGPAITTEVNVFNTLDGKWSTLPAAPRAWTQAGLASAGGGLYLLGGFEGTELRPRGETFVLPAGSLVWQQRASMPEGFERGAAAIISAPPRFYVIGGVGPSGVVASVLQYDLIDDVWTELPSLPAPRSHLAAMRLDDGTLIVAGGLSGLAPSDAHDDVFALPPNADAWESRKPMPVPRAGCAYGVAFGQLICAGGQTGTVTHAVVHSYDPFDDEWTAQPDVPAPRAGAPGVVIGNQLYVVGGEQALVLEPERTLFVFSLLDTVPRP